MDDLISRQALLDKFEPWLKVKDYNDGELNVLKAILYEIRFMRSAQPAFDAMDTQYNLPIGTDLISRRAMIEAIENNDNFVGGSYDIIKVVKSLPPAEPKRGKWLPADSLYHGAPFYCCSECGEKMLDTVMGKPRWNFCPNCGTKMEG